MKKIKFDSPIRSMILNEDKGILAVLTEDGSFRALNSHTLKLQSYFKTNLAQEHGFRRTTCISYDLDYIALAKPKTNQAMVISNKINKKILYKISRNSGEVETIFINNTNKYLISGGVDGRTYVFNLKTGHFLYNIPSHADYITSITVTNTTQLIATGSFDGVIYVTNLNTLKNPIKYRSHHAYITGLEFLNKGKLLSSDRDGNLVVYDFIQRKVKKRLPKVPDDITKIKVDSKREFVFVGTKLGKILVYDLVRETLFSDNLYKYNTAVIDIDISHDGVLYIGLQDGYVYKEQLIDEQKYDDYLKQDNYQAIYAELQTSPFIIYSKAYQEVEKKWEQILIVAKDLLAQKKINEAKQILKPFEVVSKKRSAIRTILNEFEEFGKFKFYVDNKKYSLAYPLALKYKSFIDTKEYKKMENDWIKKFNKAQDIILDPGSDETTRELLKDFRGIPTKTRQIQQLLKDKVVFNMFKRKLDSKNYQEIFHFIKQYPFLKETDAYQQLMKFADSCYINLTKELSNLNLLKAKKYLEILMNFDEFEDEVKDINNEINLLMQLTQYCKENNKIKIYEIIDSLDYDIDLECVTKMVKEWDDVIEKANLLAFKGDTTQLLKLFENFFIIKSKNEIIKKYMLSAYAKKLEYFMQKATKDDVKTNKILKNKILELYNLFGYIEEIKSIIFIFNDFYHENFTIEHEKSPKHVTYQEYKNFFLNE